MTDPRAWTQVRSRLVSTTVLVVVNLVPVPLVLAGVWRSGDVVIAYWLENVVVGVWALVQIVTARGTPSGSGRKPARLRVTVGGRTTDYADSNAAPRGLLAMFFCVHYGIFTVVHGVFALIIATMAGGVTGTVWSWLLIAAALFVSHGVSTAAHWFGHGERDETTVTSAMIRPYGRIVVLQVAVIGGFLLMGMVADGWRGDGGLALTAGMDPVVLPALLLIGLKLILDVGTHLRRFRGERRESGAPST